MKIEQKIYTNPEGKHIAYVELSVIVAGAKTRVKLSDPIVQRFLAKENGFTVGEVANEADVEVGRIVEV